MLLKPTELAIDPLEPFAKDAFERKDVIEGLVQLMGRLSGPFVIAIDSPWGTGKTTFLKMLQASLQRESFACLNFNAWETDFADDPLIAFMGETDELIRGISGVEANRLQSLDRAKRIAGAVAKRAIPAAIKAATFGALDVSDEIEKVVADAAGSMTTDAVDSYIKEKGLIKEFHKQIDRAFALVEEKGRRLPMVIFVDELDRCRPLYAIELLERIKHLFNVSSAVFVLAVDKEQLGISLGAVYGQGFNANEYLRRFFDLELKLAQIDSTRFCESLIERMGLDEFFAERTHAKTRSDSERLKTAFRDLSKLFRLTPRAQEHYMTLLALAMLTTPKDQHFNVELTAIVAAVKIGASDVYERVAKLGASVMEIIVLLENQEKSVGRLPDDFRPVVLGALLAARDHNDKSAQARYDSIVSRSSAGISGQFDQESEWILDVMRDHSFRSVKMRTIVKRIDLAAQFER